jgi:hypothetical protein
MISFNYCKVNIYSILRLRSMMISLRIEDMKAVEKSIHQCQGTCAWNFPHLVGGKLSILSALRGRLKALEKRHGFQEFHAEIMDNYEGADSNNSIIFLVAQYGTDAIATHIWRISRNRYVLYPARMAGP